MAIVNTLGRTTGKAAAYLVHGTRLGATTFAAGARDGYRETAAELRARRLAVLEQAPVPALEPAPPAPAPRQRKLATATA